MGASFKNRNIVYLLFYCSPLSNRCCLLWLHLSTLRTWTTKNVLDKDLWWLMLPMKNPQKGGKAVNYCLKLCILHWDCVIVKTIFENIAASQNHQWIIHFNSSTKTIYWRICMSHFRKTNKFPVLIFCSKPQMLRVITRMGINWLRCYVFMWHHRLGISTV